MKYTAKEIAYHDVQMSKDGKTWRPARPINFTMDSFKERVENAWGVLTGKYDALDWEETK